VLWGHSRAPLVSTDVQGTPMKFAPPPTHPPSFENGIYSRLTNARATQTRTRKSVFMCGRAKGLWNEGTEKKE